MLRLVPLQSNNLSGLAYDLVSGRLFVQFNNGTWYEYFDVPGDAVLSVLFDPVSQGKAFNTHIKEAGFVYTKVDENSVGLLDIHV